MARKLSLLFLALAVASCSYTRRHAVSGEDIEPKEAQESIVPGRTTKREIVERFKKPDRVDKQPDGSEEYLYTYRGVVEKTTELIVYARTDTNDERKNLRVVFDDDVVKEVKYTNSFAPQENFSK
ncbi:MAG: hypothetical protein ACREQQ_18955 [Candidatus Binatia bacterium]